MINGIGPSTTSLLGGVHGGAGASGTVSRLAPQRDVASAVSTTAGRIAAEGPPVDTDRVSALRAAIRGGTYRANPQAIATKMMAADLGADPGGDS